MLTTNNEKLGVSIDERIKNRKPISWKGKATSIVIAHRPPSHVNEYLRSGLDEPSLPTRKEPWAAGFVTSEGTHIPLFVRLARRQ